MKQSTYQRLTEVNAVFARYNMLAGVENLGLADCNKYYVSFTMYKKPRKHETLKQCWFNVGPAS